MYVVCIFVCVKYYSVVEIAIRQCRSSGIDCKIHGLAVRGRLRSEDDSDELPVSASSYLASDGEDDAVAAVEDELAKNDDARLRQSASVRGPREILTNVFVWGLNDKDQLGGPKGSKVSAAEIHLLAVISVQWTQRTLIRCSMHVHMVCSAVTIHYMNSLDLYNQGLSNRARVS